MDTRKVQSIEVLRGIAAFLVIWQHSIEHYVNKILPKFVNSHIFFITETLDFGRVGVVCFFLISGFVIPYSFRTTNASIKLFAIKRFFRLYPAYWLSLIAAVALFSVTPEYREIKLIDILVNLSMLQTFFHIPHVQGIYWTLQVELCFYILCALLHKAGMLKSINWQLFVVTLLLSIFACLSLIELTLYPLDKILIELVYIPFFLAIMVSGNLLRSFFTECHNNKQRAKILLAPFITFLIPTLILILYFFDININGQPVRFGLGHLLGLGLFLTGIKLLTAPPKFLLFIGSISYSLYLFHPLLIRLVHGSFNTLINTVASTSDTLGFALLFMLIGICTIALSYLTFKCIEQPSTQLAYRIKPLIK